MTYLFYILKNICIKPPHLRSCVCRCISFTFYLLSFTFYLFPPFTSFSQVVINEYSCSNIGTGCLQDNFGSCEDWIELYNQGPTAVNLNGLHLSDNIAKPKKWVFGNVSIAAGGFIRVWASGRNVNTGANLHASFKLTQTASEVIVFSDGAGTPIDSLTLKPALARHSRGRTTNGAAAWSVFTTPNPNASNINPQQEYATKPSMSLLPGFYSTPFSLTISSPDANVTIRYTTNGNTPTTTSTQYTGPITISTTTVVRARAFSSVAGIPASFVESNTYFIGVSHTVAVVSVFGNGVTTLLNGTQSKPETGFEYFTGGGGLAAESYGESNEHGNDSWSYDQRGIDFISRDQFGYYNAINYKLFPKKTRTKFQRIILKSAASDNYPFETGGAHIRDAFVHTLSQQGGMYLDERTWAPCVMYVNGQYWGVYEIREKVDDEDFLDYYFNAKEDSIQFLQTWGSTWSAYGGTQAQTDWNNLKNYILNNNMAVQSNYNYVDSLFNVKSFSDYFILNSYIVNKDWLNWNTAWWRGLNVNCAKRKWRYCLWDQDAVFGHYTNYTGIPDPTPSANPCDPQTIGDPGGQGHALILSKLLQNPGFKAYYINRYADLLNTTFSCSNMIGLLDSMLALIQPEMAKHFQKWGGTQSGWNANVQAMKNFIYTRCPAVVSGFDTCYSVTGPYTIMVDVQPPGAGKIQVNSITPASYAWSGSYFGNLAFSLKASSNPGFQFDHWLPKNHTLSPGNNDSNVTFTLVKTDTVIAYFNTAQVFHNLVFIVDPPLAGDVDIKGFVPPSYPYSGNYPGGDTIALKALAAAGYEFKNWQLQNHTVAPSATDSSGSFILATVDTVIAHFDKKHKLTFIVDPPLAGNIQIKTFIPPSYPYTADYTGGDTINIAALASAGYEFNNWQLQNHTVTPSATDSNASFILTTTDTVIAHFNKKHNLTFIVDPPLTGDIKINSFIPASYPFNTSYTNGYTINIAALAASGYVFKNWEAQNNVIQPGIADSVVFFVLGNNDTIIAHFGKKYPLTIIIDPPLAGDVNINGYIPTVYPYTGGYADSSTINLKALAATGYEFKNWETQNHIVQPGVNDTVVSFMLTMGDTVIAHFNKKYPLTVIIEPPLSGNVDINGFVPSLYPYTNTYLYADTINLKAIAAAGYIFKNWESQNHTLQPGVNDSVVSFLITTGDTVIAHFVKKYSLTIIVDPPLAGNVNVSGTVPVSYPYTATWLGGTTINLSALAAAGYVFKNWELQNHSVIPGINDSVVSFVLTANDTVIAHFNTQYLLTVIVQPPASGTVSVNGFSPSFFPYTSSITAGSAVNIKAVSASGFRFDYWKLSNHTVTPGTADSNITLVLVSSDTAIAWFKQPPPPELPGIKGFFVPSGFSPNGDNNNDVLQLFAGVDVQAFHFAVYDRWGNKVFETTNTSDKWDGSYKGDLAEAGVYAYQVEIKMSDGTQKTTGGNITVVR